MAVLFVWLVGSQIFRLAILSNIVYVADKQQIINKLEHMKTAYFYFFLFLCLIGACNKKQGKVDTTTIVSPVSNLVPQGFFDNQTKVLKGADMQSYLRKEAGQYSFDLEPYSGLFFINDFLVSSDTTSFISTTMVLEQKGVEKIVSVNKMLLYQDQLWVNDGVLALVDKNAMVLSKWSTDPRLKPYQYKYLVEATHGKLWMSVVPTGFCAQSDAYVFWLDIALERPMAQDPTKTEHFMSGFALSVNPAKNKIWVSAH